LRRPRAARGATSRRFAVSLPSRPREPISARWRLCRRIPRSLLSLRLAPGHNSAGERRHRTPSRRSVLRAEFPGPWSTDAPRSKAHRAAFRRSVSLSAMSEPFAIPFHGLRAPTEPLYNPHTGDYARPHLHAEAASFNGLYPECRLCPPELKAKRSRSSASPHLPPRHSGSKPIRWALQ
jgi:hypothetical protein